MDRLTRIKKIPKNWKKSFTCKTDFSFKDLMQSSKSPFILLVTLNNLTGTLYLFTKHSIHWNLFKPTFKLKIRKLRTIISATFQLHTIWRKKKTLNIYIFLFLFFWKNRFLQVFRQLKKSIASLFLSRVYAA